MRFPVNRAGASGACLKAIGTVTFLGRSRGGLFAAWASGCVEQPHNASTGTALFPVPAGSPSSVFPVTSVCIPAWRAFDLSRLVWVGSTSPRRYEQPCSESGLIVGAGSNSRRLFLRQDVARVIAAKQLPNTPDPRKDPAWRWLRCGYLLNHRRRPSSRDDDATREAWLFRRALGRCRAEEDREWLARNFPALAEAHRRFTTDELLQRATLEAHLLAGESDDLIAARCAMRPAGVLAYHDVYFEVRPYLKASGYIATVVLAGKPYKGIARDDHEAVLKSLAYELGGEMIDAILDFLRDAPVVPASLTDLDVPALRRLHDRLQVKVAVLALTTPAADLPPATWLRLLQDLATSRQARTADRGEAAVPCTIQAALDAAGCLSYAGHSDGGAAVGEPAGGSSTLSVARASAVAAASSRDSEAVPA